MTAKEQIKLIGSTRTYRLDALTIDVTVEDVKGAYGQTRLRITPVAGAGLTWVNIQSTQAKG